METRFFKSMREGSPSRCLSQSKSANGAGPCLVDRNAFGTFVFLMLAIAGVVMANDCVEATQRESFRAAALVFRGRVSRIDDLAAVPSSSDNQMGKAPLEPSISSDPKLITFSVERVWKGKVGKIVQTFVLEHPPMGTGYQFRLGSEYVVYALNEIGQKWQPARQTRRRQRIYDIGITCTLRVRTDVSKESHLLGLGKSPE